MLSNLFNFPRQMTEFKLNIYQPTAVYDIAMKMRSIGNAATSAGHQIIVLCIGTDRSTGDALGPLTGSKLYTLLDSPNILGTLDEPVHATNLTDALERIKNSFENPYVIAVDACLGKLENVGCVSIGLGSLKPGAALNKDLPTIGNAYVTGIVNVGGFMEHLVLQSTRLKLVMKMADTIAHGLSFGLRGYL